MNKKTGEFSAADLKKPAGRKAEKMRDSGPSSSNTPVPGRFICRSCYKEHPDSAAAKDDPSRQMCIACAERVQSITDGTFRDNKGCKHEASKRIRHRAVAKKYKAGKLPGWMFS